MKQLYFFIALTFVFSCTKQNFTAPISGTWTIVETNNAESGSIEIQTFSPSTEVTLEFGGNGNLILTGTNPGTARSPLWAFDKYEMLENNIIRFYQSAGSKKAEAFYSIEGNLFLNYLAMRHGYEEKFLRLR